ncbi:MAG: ribonuclease R [Thermodesulfovibrionia bacterium]|nr:ribonuclease R [Thermodesulfovibrionia bacterium]
MNPKNIKDSEAILTYLSKKTSKPLKLKELAKQLGTHKSGVRKLGQMLESLVQSGKVFRTRTGCYGVAEQMNLLSGIFEAHKNGFGFVLPEKSGEKDIFIPPRKTLGAMSGDSVVVRVESSIRREGSVLKILARGQKNIIGRLYLEKTTFYVKPKGRRLPLDVFIAPNDRGKAKDGDLVLVELTSYPTATRPPEGKVLKVLPEVDEPRREIDMIIEERSLPLAFPDNVLREAKGFSEILSPDNRVDCRDLLTVTIDGEDAKDFDDAISIKKIPEGHKLYVHIADVSHYVPWDTDIDLEARERGTSIYFPGNVIPMLPERLSNNLCSLMPKVDRFAFTAEMDIDKNGKLIKRKFYPSIINSNERMTYNSVKKILVDNDPAEREKYGYLLENFEIMKELYLILKEMRIQRGSLDFDLPEPYIILDIQGTPEDIIRADRNMSHMLIEEFMIAANEAVASYLEGLGVPSLYRIHEEPDTDKLDELMPILRAFGLKIKTKGVKAFHAILEASKGLPEETLLNTLLLRSLKQAKYSKDNVGHFGLASDSYTHFTSPIRRYPDLVVHRVLREIVNKKKLSDKSREFLEKNLAEIALQSSKTERASMEAEREIVSAMKAWFMKDKVGNEYEGMVSNINPKGMAVQLQDYFVTGFIHVSDMGDDYYIFDEARYRLKGRRSKRTFTLGDKVMVRVEKVDIEERDITLGLVHKAPIRKIG